MELWVAKVLSGVVVLAITLACGLIPIWLIRRLSKTGSSDWRQHHPRLNFILGLLSAFGGGVFLGTAFLLLLPEARHWWDAVFGRNDVDYPAAEAVAISGLILIMLLEHIVMKLQHDKDEFPDLGAQEHVIHNGQGQIIALNNNNQVIGANGQCQIIQGQGQIIQAFPVQQGPMVTSQNPNVKIVYPNGQTGLVQAGGSTVQNLAFSPYTGLHVVHHVTPPQFAPHPQGLGSRVSMIESSHFDHHRHSHANLRSARSLILLLALSVHTVFDGLAIGLSVTEDLVWTLLLAISLHKALVVFVLGLQLAESRYRSRSVIFLVLFALITPIGIGIGIAVMETGDGGQGQNIATAVLQSLSAGVFVYVTFFEILHQEVGRDHSIIKVMAVIVGIAVMAGLASLGHGHEHGGHGGHDMDHGFHDDHSDH